MFVLIGLYFLVLTAFGDSYYRRWIYTHHYFDFGLANYLPSITGTISSAFFMCAFSKNFPRSLVASAIGVSIGAMIYESLQPTFGTGVFDWQDFAAVCVTGVLLVVFMRRYAQHYSETTGLHASK